MILKKDLSAAPLGFLPKEARAPGGINFSKKENSLHREVNESLSEELPTLHLNNGILMLKNDEMDCELDAVDSLFTS